MVAVGHGDLARQPEQALEIEREEFIGLIPYLHFCTLAILVHLINHYLCDVSPGGKFFALSPDVNEIDREWGCGDKRVTIRTYDYVRVFRHSN